MRLTDGERRDQVRQYLVEIALRSGETVHSISENLLDTKSEYLAAIEEELPEVQGFAVILSHESGNPFQTSVEDNLRIARAHSERWAGKTISTNLDRVLFLSPFHSQWGQEVYSLISQSSISAAVARKLDDAEVRDFVLRFIWAGLVRENQNKKLRECGDSPAPTRGLLNIPVTFVASLPIELPEYREFLQNLTVEEILDLCSEDWGGDGVHTWETAVGVTECILELSRELDYEGLVWGMISDVSGKSYRKYPDSTLFRNIFLTEMVAGSHGVTAEAVLREYFAGKERGTGRVAELEELIILLCGKNCTWVSPKSANDYVLKELWKASGSVETTVSVIREAALNDRPRSAAVWKDFCDNWETMKGFDVNLALSLSE